ncbi:MAG: O-antigen ligase family protein [Burkholderiales bacterium]|nr:O-antigen ligase family protein [Burkholderiales bacterium]
MKRNQENIFEAWLNVGPVYILVFLLFIIPMLIPYSYYPVSKFSSEVLAGILGASIGFFVILRAKRIDISSVTIAIILFGVFLLAQPLLIPIRLPGINMAIASWFWAAAMMSVGVASFINGDAQKQQNLITVVCWAIFISAFIQAFYGLLQYTGEAANLNGLMLYVDTQSVNVFGNIGQKNDYVDFLSMGVFALSYLYFSRKIKLSTYVIYEFFFILIISITTSRTSFVYFIFALIITGIFIFAHRKKHENKIDNKKVLFIILGLLVGLMVVEALFPLLMKIFSSRTDVTSGIYRFGESSVGQSTYRRFYEWYKCLVIFINHPLFGIGWYQYPKEAIDLMLKDSRFWYIPANSALYTHSHNSLLNIMAETGLVGSLIIIGYGFFYTIYNMFKNFNNHATLFLVFIILTMFGQSLFQYPLWYAYFFMYFMLLLSINKPVISFNNTKLFKGIFSVIFIGFIYFCGLNYQIYMQIVSYTTQPKNIDDYATNLKGLQQIIEYDPLWVFPSLMVLDNYIQVGSKQTTMVLSKQEQTKYIDMLGNLLPYPGAIIKQLVVHKMIGDNKSAMYYANLLAHGFPFFKDQFATQLEQMSPIFAPEVKAIRDFKYEDRSIFANKLFKNSKLKEG